MTIQQDFSF